MKNQKHLAAITNLGGSLKSEWSIGTVAIDGIKAVTEKAVLIIFSLEAGDRGQAWLPKSMIRALTNQSVSAPDWKLDQLNRDGVPMVNVAPAAA